MNLRGYGIQAVIFHVPLGRQDAWVAHFSVLDEAGGAFTYDQSRSSGRGMRQDSFPDGFDLNTPLLQFTGSAFLRLERFRMLMTIAVRKV